METDFEELIPKGAALLSIKDIDDLKIIKSDMMKKIIYNREIEIIKIGKKNFISRLALIAYLESNVIPAAY